MTKSNKGRKRKPRTAAQKKQSKINNIDKRIIKRAETLSRVSKRLGGNSRGTKAIADSGKRMMRGE